MMKAIAWKLVLGFVIQVGACQAIAQRQTLARPIKLTDGIVLRVGDSFLKVEVCTESVIHVAYAHDDAFFKRRSLAAAPKACEPTKWNLATGPRETWLVTAKLRVRVNLATGALGFFDQNGRRVAVERNEGRTLTPATVQGDKTFHVRQTWEANNNEALYGLGQHQLGLMDIKGYDLDLWQTNTIVIVPFLVSSRGYGILWDNTSWTRFGDLRDFEFIPSANLFDAGGKPGSLTGSYYAGANFDRLEATRNDERVDITTPDRKEHPHTRIHPNLPAKGEISVRWEGSVEPQISGDYLL